MTAEITPETLRLAGEVSASLKEVPGAGGTAVIPHAQAIDDLIAHATEMQAVKRVAEIQHALIGELGFETKCHCIEAYTARGLHEPNSLCHFDAEVVAIRAEYKRLTETPRPATTGEGMGEG